MLEKTDSSENNPEKSYAIKINKHPSCRFSLSMEFPHEEPKNEKDFFEGPD